jgi:hypothetical protein
MPKKVAAIVTEYRWHSHADVIVGKIPEGPLYDGKNKFDLELISLYVDQKPRGDMSADLARKYGFSLCKTIEEALLREGKLAVDGVLCIGEHGDYPMTEQGQIQYPRRRFFEEVTKVFVKVGRSVPIFNDKHLSYRWEDAKWMVERARELHVPFLAGSSLPVTWRRPELKFERGVQLIEAVQLAYGPIEGYGFHALEAIQCMAERRGEGEVGVEAVTYLTGEAMWEAMDKGRWSKEVFDATLALVTAHAQGDVRALTTKSKDAALFLIEYRDGFKAAVPVLNGWLYEGTDGGYIFAAKVKDRDKPAACVFYQQQPDPFGHFIALVRAIDTMIQTGHPPYPIERTLLTTGILDAVFRSKREGKRVLTPHLAIKYQPTDYPFATDPIPREIKREKP